MGVHIENKFCLVLTNFRMTYITAHNQHSCANKRDKKGIDKNDDNHAIIVI